MQGQRTKETISISGLALPQIAAVSNRPASTAAKEFSVTSELSLVTSVFGFSGRFSRRSPPKKRHSLYPVDLLRLEGINLICD